LKENLQGMPENLEKFKIDEEMKDLL